MIRGLKLPCARGYSTIVADMDFETYSEAGFIWNESAQKYEKPKGAQKAGISAVGAVAYSEHPSTEVLCLAYDLKDGFGERLWIPGMPDPVDLFEHLKSGGIVEAWNCGFEYWIWKNVCEARMGWPPLPFWQLRDAMAKSQGFAWPAKLEKAGSVAGTLAQKMKDGQRLIRKFSIPRKPTKKNLSRRIKPADDLLDAQNLYDYCVMDIKTEAAISAKCPDLSPAEQEFWLCTQAMNVRGVALDMITVRAAVSILDQALERYDEEIAVVTGGRVEKASELDKLKDWIFSTTGVALKSINKDNVDDLAAGFRRFPAVKRALEIRSLVGSAGVKKLYAMERMVSRAGRVHDLFVYHGARTGRDTGRDLQPQNLVKAGPPLTICNLCGRSFGRKHTVCIYCGSHETVDASWGWEAVEDAVGVIRAGSLDRLEYIYGDALLTISGCIRGLFVPADNYDFICSDYSSIEAVVTAALAGEQWRLDTFARGENIYLVSASRITGVPLDEYKEYARVHGTHHPDRNKIGKPAELGYGFGGWIGAHRQFDDTDNFTDDEVKRNILAWRGASPAIVEFWGGQVRGKPWDPKRKELYGLEGMAIAAVQYPGREFSVGQVTFFVQNDILFCRLPSGRHLTYHEPRLTPSDRWPEQVQLSYMGWNSNAKMGPFGWVRIKTYGGRLCENIVQATARDIMAHAVPIAERAGYPIVLRVHDELVAEVPEGFGSIGEFEGIMATLPAWAAGWPVKAAGGWRGKRYRKD